MNNNNNNNNNKGETLKHLSVRSLFREPGNPGMDKGHKKEAKKFKSSKETLGNEKIKKSKE